MLINTQRRRILLGGVCAGAALMLRPAYARKPYPEKSIRFIVPFAPGGGTDIIGRAFANKMSDIIGGVIVVENLPGAGGAVGSGRVARAQPDGYTLLLSNVASQAIAPGVNASLPYDPMADFEHIALFGSFPNILIVRPNIPANNVEELVAHAKRSTRALVYASAGVGSSPHLCGELLKQRTGISSLHVAYKGSSPARLAWLRGDTDYQFENFATALPLLQNGDARALAVTSDVRALKMPDLPTMQESGISDFAISSWYGLSTPAQLPSGVAKQLADATVEAQKDEKIVALLTDMGMAPSALKPNEYSDFVKREIAKMAQIITAAGIKAE